jgi:hypothetical protein
MAMVLSSGFSWAECGFCAIFGKSNISSLDIKIRKLL